MRYISLMALCVFSFTFFVYCSSEKAAFKKTATRRADSDPFVRSIVGSWWMVDGSPLNLLSFDEDGIGVFMDGGVKFTLTCLDTINIRGFQGAYFQFLKEGANPRYTFCYIDNLMFCFTGKEYMNLEDLKKELAQFDPTDTKSRRIIAIPDNRNSTNGKDFLSKLQGSWNETFSTDPIQGFFTWNADNTGKMKVRSNTYSQQDIQITECDVQFQSVLELDGVLMGIFYVNDYLALSMGKDGLLYGLLNDDEERLQMHYRVYNLINYFDQNDIKKIAEKA